MESQERKTENKIQDAIKHSRAVVFLGFGFAKQNLDLLGINKDLSLQNNFRRSIYATAYGLSDYRINQTKHYLSRFVEGDPRFIDSGPMDYAKKVVLENCECGALINEYSDLWFD